jgi:hypothetical protein
MRLYYEKTTNLYSADIHVVLHKYIATWYENVCPVIVTPVVLLKSLPITFVTIIMVLIIRQNDLIKWYHFLK